MVANGDHVYWDLLSPQGSRVLGASPEAISISGTFNRSAAVFGADNETVLKLAASPQIVPVYGTEFRSTPVFFLQDDHDYFENDEATAAMVTFPPSWFMLQLARATQRLYYPEFLPDAGRPANLPWSSAGEISTRLGGGAISSSSCADAAAGASPRPAMNSLFASTRWSSAASAFRPSIETGADRVITAATSVPS